MFWQEWRGVKWMKINDKYSYHILLFGKRDEKKAATAAKVEKKYIFVRHHKMRRMRHDEQLFDEILMEWDLVKGNFVGCIYTRIQLNEQHQRKATEGGKIY